MVNRSEFQRTNEGQNLRFSDCFRHKKSPPDSSQSRMTGTNDMELGMGLEPTTDVYGYVAHRFENVQQMAL